MAADDVLWTRWNEIDALLEQALERPAEARATYVAGATTNDEQLRAVVLRLLDRLATDADRVTGPSDALVMGAFPADAEPDPDLPAGTAIGHYVVARRRARGGMATVYEAERADGAYQQRVALKVLRRGLDTEDLVRRFVVERQILSSLSHPNIARLVDGGSTADGRPYLVMELVDGEPITRFADARRLDVAARLELFLQAADGVHAAHRQLVVHRDIKPSNILVDEAGGVKLLDFGIAKLVSGDAEHTQAGARAMTPDYASPEQLRGGPITTATDVYQLGLLLRELLTGVRRLSRAPESDEADARASRLAARRFGAADAPADRAAARATTAEKLARRLRGDLDIIIARALQADPDQRYASADEMASDVRRHLAGLPIVAHPGSRRYRLRKFARRNPLGLAAAGFAVVALVGYALTITVQNRRVAAERDRATREALKAEQVTEFLVQLFESADPNASGGSDVTARELLDRGVTQLEREAAGDPEARAAMLSAIARSYRALGLYAPARAVLERAIDERGGADTSLSRAVVSDMGLLAVIVARSDRDRAREHFEQALARAERLGPADPLVARILTDYAEFRARMAPGDPAWKTMLQRAVAILRAAPGEHRGDLAHALTVSAYGQDPDVALPLLHEGLALRRSLHGELHSTVASGLSDVALATESVDPLASDSLMLEALTIAEKLYGRRHAMTLAIMNNLAGLRRDRGAYADAVPLYREVLALRRELYPDEVIPQAYAMYGLGLTLSESGAPREGESHLREALRILASREAPGSPLLSLTRAAIGYSLARQQRFAEAERLLRDAYRAIRQAPLSGRERANALERVIWLYRAWPRPELAARFQAELDSLLAEAGSPGGG